MEIKFKRLLDKLKLLKNLFNCCVPIRQEFRKICCQGWNQEATSLEHMHDRMHSLQNGANERPVIFLAVTVYFLSSVLTAWLKIAAMCAVLMSQETTWNVVNCIRIHLIALALTVSTSSSQDMLFLIWGLAHCLVWTECTDAFQYVNRKKIWWSIHLVAHPILTKVRVCKKLVHTLQEFPIY